MKKILINLCMILILVSLLSPVHGASTRFWELDSFEGFQQGRFSGTGLSSEGVVKPSISTEKDTIPARVVWDRAENIAGTMVGSSQPAALYWLSKDDGATPQKVIDRPGMGFTALASVSEKIYAGFTPGAIIYSGYEAEDFSQQVELEGEFVLAMLPDNQERGLFVGTGDPGRIYYLEPGEEPQLLAELSDQIVLSLVELDDYLYAGTARGMLYRQSLVEPEEPIEAVYGFPRGEIRSMAVQNGSLYLGINRFQPRNGQLGNRGSSERITREMIERQMGQRDAGAPVGEQAAQYDGELTDHSPAPQAEQIDELFRETVRQRGEQTVDQLFEARTGGLVVKFTPPDGMQLLLESERLEIFDLFATDTALYLGSGAEGRLVKIDRQHRKTVFYSTDQRQVTSLHGAGGKLQGFTTANGGVVYRVSKFEVGTASYLSPVFDAQLLSRWGEFASYVSGPVRVRTRSGLTDQPGEEWSEWSAWEEKRFFKITSKPARFLQFEMEFLSPEAELNRVEIARLASNQSPRIVEFEISPDPRQQIIFDDSKRLSEERILRPSEAAPTEIFRRLVGDGEERQRTVRWEAVDPDGDQLIVSLYYRPLAAENWIKLAGPRQLADGKEDRWDPRQFADGRYQLKLRVSDELSNPPGESFVVSRTIGPVVVDNSAPRVENLNYENGLVSFTAVDQTSRIITVYYRLDGGDWKTLRSLDGMLDSRLEEFELLIDQTESVELLEIMVIDASGNRRIVKHLLDD